jgi:hypothetical protein
MHLSEELARDGAEKVVVETKFGRVGGRRAMNGSAVFLGSSIIAFSLSLTAKHSLMIH